MNYYNINQLKIKFIYNIYGNFTKSNNFLTQVKHQISVADTLIIKKTDIESDKNKLETLLKEINPFAKIHKTQYCRILLAIESTEVIAIKLQDKHIKLEKTARPEIDAIALKITNLITYEALTLFLKEINPLTIRIKGFIRLTDTTFLAVHCVFSTIETSVISQYKGIKTLIIIGYNLNRQEIEKRYKELCSLPH